MGELAFAVLRRQLAVLRAKEPGTRLGEDPEELHDMRVATRRLRAALSLFEGVLPVRAQVFREELGWLGRLLGRRARPRRAAGGPGGHVRRDVDGRRPAPDGHDPLAELAALLEREREAARADMLSGLDSVRWDRLAKGLTAMAQQGPARRSLATRVPGRNRPARAWCWRATTRCAKAAKRAKQSGVVTDFHALRIRCKRLRYALEFSSEVYGGQTSRFVRELTVLQDELGEMQDAEVASLQLADLATGDAHLPAATIFVMGGVAERHRREVKPAPQTAARRVAPHRGAGLARAARPHGAPSGRGRGGPAAGPHAPCAPCPGRQPEAERRRRRRRPRPHRQPSATPSRCHPAAGAGGLSRRLTPGRRQSGQGE